MLFYYSIWSFFLLLLGMFVYLLGIFFLFFDYSILIDWEIFTLNSCSVVMTLLLDWMSFLFIGSVMFISSMVLFYSGSYMLNDNNKLRFMFLVVLFIISMCLMIISPNLISILLGWDGLGLVSYCLVIYYQNFGSYNAGMLTILTNRLGDVAILLGVGLMFNDGSWYFMYHNFYNYLLGSYLIFMVVMASFTKSAQLPFSSWLPAAMAAPTPVSALVHSSTLVTAGVYLMIRFNYLFTYYDMSLFLFISVLTMFMSGLGAVFEYDIKKIIALSTLSQLGLMISILFMGFPTVSYFHLLTHAFFKALLFLCAGLIIHCVNDVQDIRFMGGLVNILPFTISCFGISNFSLCGLPFLSGFYSKDLVLELMTMNMFNIYIYIIFYLSIGLTVCYSVRLMYYVLFNYVGLSSYGLYIEDKNMINSMIFLSFMGVIKGSILCWLIFPWPNLIFMPLLLKIMPLLFVMVGFIMGFEISYLYYYSSFYFLNYNFMVSFFGSMWFLPSFSTYMIYSKGFNISSSYYLLIDSGWGEYLISKMLCLLIIFWGKFLYMIQNNNLKIFSLIFVVLIVGFIFI
uniref:NADH-ubiquinone oxidoreductase chain 5 n=1 Tax=Nysius fuscovittatus TaxID=881686 RepID=A0A7D5JY53_9HEMI|nr:NADH dehydrogenase subunit 5 [Nysius fuscovittatus]QLF99806.1 NADH dehydrogenase subunit 5 [Nysius fuscovittatus]